MAKFYGTSTTVLYCTVLDLDLEGFALHVGDRRLLPSRQDVRGQLDRHLGPCNSTRQIRIFSDFIIDVQL